MSRKMDPVIHFEMPAEDLWRAPTFYENTFGWQTHDLGPDMGNFVLAFTTETDENRLPKHIGAINGGFYERKNADEQIKLTILVDDIQAAIEKIEAAGGTVIGKPLELPGVGLFATFLDTERNLIILNQDNTLKRLPEAYEQALPLSLAARLRPLDEFFDGKKTAVLCNQRPAVFV